MKIKIDIKANKSWDKKDILNKVLNRMKEDINLLVSVNSTDGGMGFELYDTEWKDIHHKVIGNVTLRITD